MLYRRIRNLELVIYAFIKNNTKLYVFSIEHSIDGVLKNAAKFPAFMEAFHKSQHPFLTLRENSIKYALVISSLT